MPPPFLDPDAVKLLEERARSGLPPDSMSPEEARRAEARALRRAPPPFVPLGERREIAAIRNGSAVRGRLYRPFGVTAQDRLPGLVYLHGGGWMAGSPDTHDHICADLARRAGIAVFSVDYPLAPEAPFPAAVEAAVAAFAHAAAADSLGIDPARLGIGGDSAGANLAAVVALTARDGALPTPRVQLLFYPAMDLTLSRLAPGNAHPQDLFTADSMRCYVDHYLAGADPRDWRASPLLVERLGGLPPAYVMTAGADVLAEDGRAWADRLEAEGVPVRRRHFPGQIHGFLRAGELSSATRTALADASGFLVAGLCRQGPARGGGPHC